MLHHTPMLTPPIPPDEAKRLELLRACRILYTPAEEAFDDVARLAAQLCQTEIALITLVDAQTQWFKARVGVEQTELPRDLSFCGHCINHDEPLVVRDTLLDPRFADNPLVLGEPHLRFYVGVPLEVAPGSAGGARAVAGRTPRDLTPQQLDSLVLLSRQISRELRLRRDYDRVRSERPPSATLSLAPGAVLDGRWQVVRELGRGGVGAVFEARGLGGERVAIKVLLPEWRHQEAVLERFAREARVLMRLSSPHVGKLLGVGNLERDRGDLPYLVLEFLEGTDLDQLITLRGRVPFRLAFRWCADACDGVADAHAMGVVHRDLKPSNLFLARSGQGVDQVKVLDFGIAAGERTLDSEARLTRMQGPIGSPAYMSPEQMVVEEVDARTDIWSMGATLYEAVTGQLPFQGETEMQIFAAAMTRPPLPPRALKSELPASAEAVILRCLRKKREDRFGSMHELAAALRSVAAQP
jgi:hypothetical protein